MKILIVLALLAIFRPAFAEERDELITRFGAVQAEVEDDLAHIRIAYGGRDIARVAVAEDTTAVALYRVTVAKGPREYVIVKTWDPGLHCHHLYVMVTIHQDGTTYASKPFGECMDLTAAAVKADAVMVTLESVWIEGRTTRRERYRWKDGVLRKVR